MTWLVARSGSAVLPALIDANSASLALVWTLVLLIAFAVLALAGATLYLWARALAFLPVMAAMVLGALGRLLGRAARRVL